ncbi:MAG: DUF1731 domain-containing protein, partial [Acidobacteriaceae bacterium]|nr:DUF1731 domain-containing protein [Acidobacteriaceae bacterium]
EREATRGREFGLRVVPVRIAVVLGPNGGALKQMAAPFRLGLGGKLGSGRQWMSWIYLDDLVRLFIFAVNEPTVDSTLNGSAPGPVTNAEFTDQLAKVVRRPAFASVPKIALKIAMGEVAEYMFHSARVVPERAQQHGFRFQYPDVSAALCEALR